MCKKVSEKIILRKINYSSYNLKQINKELKIIEQYTHKIFKSVFVKKVLFYHYLNVKIQRFFAYKKRLESD